MWLGSSFVQMIYGTEYGGYQDVLILLAASVAMTATAMAPSQSLSLLELPNLNFWFNLIGLVSVGSLALVLGTIDGLRGAVWGLLLGSLVPTILKWVWYRRVVRQRTNSKIPNSEKIQQARESRETIEG